MANLIEHVVVDSGAFIRNAPVKDIGRNAYTISDVVAEIRDKVTRQSLQILPYKLNFKEPDSESIRFVTSFTKKTGDYPSLSATDIRLIALTYQLEKEHVGLKHIKTKPDKKAEFQMGASNLGSNLGTEIAGFYVEKSKKNTDGASQKGSDVGSSEPGPDVSSDESSTQKTEETAEESCESVVTVETERTVAEVSASDSQTNAEEELVEKVSEIDIKSDKSRYFRDGDTVRGDDITEGDESDSEGESESESESESDEESGEEGWITPSNVDEMNQMMTGVTGGDVTATCQVGCLTTDFAMQNVLIQMGLSVLSVDGLLIKKAKSYVLRCYSCFKISTNMEKRFCHHCGNETLRRLAVAINDDGSMKYFLSKKMPKLRKREHIPLPKGGKYSNYPKLTEDQRLPQRRQAKTKHQHYGVFDEDFIANASPFAVRDTTSRSAMVGAGRNFNKRHGGDNVRRRKK